MMLAIWLCHLISLIGGLLAATGAGVFLYQRLWTKALAYTLSAIAFVVVYGFSRYVEWLAANPTANGTGVAILFAFGVVIIGCPTILVVGLEGRPGRLLSRDAPVAQAYGADRQTCVPDGDKSSPTPSIDQDSDRSADQQLRPTETQLVQLPQSPKAIDGQEPVIHDKDR